MPTIVIAYAMAPADRAVVTDVIGGLADPVYLTELEQDARETALRSATAVLSRNLHKELRDREAELLAGTRLVQFMTAGVDFIPLKALPASKRIPMPPADR